MSDPNTEDLALHELMNFVDATFPKAPPVMVWKAIGDSVPDLNLVACDPIPNMPRIGGEAYPGFEQRCAERFREQAGLILTALLRSLPGGTIDQLLVKLLKHKAGLLHIPHVGTEDK